MTITLRPITPADLDFMMRLVTDREVTRYISGMITDRETMEMWLREDSKGEYIVEANGLPVGECSLYNEEIGFMILPEFWQKGIGTEVVRQLEEKAEEECGTIPHAKRLHGHMPRICEDHFASIAETIGCK